MDPPLDRPRSADELQALAGPTITDAGSAGSKRPGVRRGPGAGVHLGRPSAQPVLRAGAPTEAAILFDLVVGASSIYGGSWLEGAGAVYAENQALRWLADLAGLPAEAGGVFVPGGTTGNLPRSWPPARWRRAPGPAAAAAARPSRSAQAPSSSAARVMDADLVVVPATTGAGSRATLRRRPRRPRPSGRPAWFAVVRPRAPPTSGSSTTSRGRARRRARPVVPRRRRLRRRRARRASVRAVRRHRARPTPSSSTPTSGCSRRSTAPRAVPRARAGPGAPTPSTPSTSRSSPAPEWNPSDYAIHLTRRARGLPFWFSLAAHGTEAYPDAVEDAVLDRPAATDPVAALRRAGARARAVDRALPPPRLGTEDYDRWSDRSWPTGSPSYRRRAAARRCCASASSTRAHGRRRRRDPRHHGLRVPSRRTRRSWRRAVRSAAAGSLDSPGVACASQNRSSSCSVAAVAAVRRPRQRRWAPACRADYAEDLRYFDVIYDPGAVGIPNDDAPQLRQLDQAVAPLQEDGAFFKVDRPGRPPWTRFSTRLRDFAEVGAGPSSRVSVRHPRLTGLDGCGHRLPNSRQPRRVSTGRVGGPSRGANTGGWYAAGVEAAAAVSLWCRGSGADSSDSSSDGRGGVVRGSFGPAPWVVLIVGVLVVGGLFLWSRLKKSKGSREAR